MKNVFFPEDEISIDDLYFVYYMVERVARRLKQPNKYVVNIMGHDEIAKKLSLASVLHSANPEATESDWIEEYHLQPGNYNKIAYYEPSPYITRSYYFGGFN